MQVQEPTVSTPVITAAYCDGGLLDRNPSAIGGTWAYVLISKDDEVVRQGSGTVLVNDEWGMDRITNNFTELLAALKAMEQLPDGWNGTIYTDSLITLRRITGGQSFVGIPVKMKTEVRHQLARLSHRAVLLGGHPTAKELRMGRTARGYPCSRWNVACDAACNEESERYWTEAAREVLQERRAEA